MTRADDAATAAALGADAVGLVFYDASPRNVTIDQARDIVAALPPLVSVVALFVDAAETTINQVLENVPVDILQFHGDEPAPFCQQFNRPWIKALRVRSGMDMAHCGAPYGAAKALLLDSWQAGVPGGTGKTFDWKLARFPCPRPLILAGGLNAQNVGAAVCGLRPAAVDVSGGVESAPGHKDAVKMSEFIAAVKAADQQLDGRCHDS